MKVIEKSIDPLVLRLDFTNQVVWEQICFAIQKPVNGFYACVTFLSDPIFEDISVDDVCSRISGSYNHNFIFVVDNITIREIDHPLLVLDLATPQRTRFRAIPSTIQCIENNLSIGNMSFEEFNDSVDESGIFRIC